MQPDGAQRCHTVVHVLVHITVAGGFHAGGGDDIGILVNDAKLRVGASQIEANDIRVLVHKTFI